NDVVSAQGEARSLTEFDISRLELSDSISGFPIPADGDSGFFVTITEATASITLPVFDDGADEIEADEVFTFAVIEGENYEVNADKSSVTVNISDDPIVSFSATPTVISEAEGTELVMNFSVDGDIPEEGITVSLEGDAARIMRQFTAAQTRFNDAGEVLYRFDKGLVNNKVVGG
ncbi:MAG: calcium-binding protein, partial [Cyanobacteria bacterium J06641_2]